MTFQTLTTKEFENMRKQVLKADFMKINHVLAQKPVGFRFVDAGNHVPGGWSNPNEIFVNTTTLGSLASAETLVRVLGLNYHELSHVKYTNPMSRAALGVVQGTFGHPAFVQNVWNLMEDQRIEYLFLHEYSATHPYFVSIIGRYIINKPEANWDNLYLLVAQRTYLDPKVVAGLRQRYVDAHDEDAADRVEDILGQYVDLGEITHENRSEAANLLEEMCELLAQTSEDEELPESPHHDGEASVSVTIPGAGNGSGAGKGEKSEAGDEDGEGSGEGDEEDEGDESEGGSGSGDEDDDEEGSSGGADGSEDEEGDESSGKGSKSGSDGPEDANSHGKGAGQGGSEITADELRKQASAQVAEAEGSQEVRSAVSERQRSLTNRQTLSKVSFSTNPVKPQAILVTPKEQLISRRVAAEFSRVALEQDPGYLPMQSVGRINMQRAMNPEHDPETVFDQWQEGQQDASDMEVVILVDVSDSMNGSGADIASRSAWMLHNAINASSQTSQVTVFTFGNVTRLASARGVVASKSHRDYYGASGGTSVGPAMEAARMIFATSTKKKAVLFVISDGEFYDDSVAKMQVGLMNGAGVTTSLVFINTNGYHTYMRSRYNADGIPNAIIACNFNVITKVSDVDHLVKFGKDVIKSVIAKPTR
ncbi:MAG: vWA domain-containing protein [Rhizobiaceae bacterium]